MSENVRECVYAVPAHNTADKEGCGVGQPMQLTENSCDFVVDLRAREISFSMIQLVLKIFHQ